MSVVSRVERTIYASHMSLFLADLEHPDDNDYDWHDEATALQRVCPGKGPFEAQIATTTSSTSGQANGPGRSQAAPSHHAHR